MTYKVTGDGTVSTTLEYETPEGVTDIPEFGMLFRFDADLENLTWYGYGPEETYCDREKGGKLGIYHKKVTENLAEYLVPQECGNHTGVRRTRRTSWKMRCMSMNCRRSITRWRASHSDRWGSPGMTAGVRGPMTSICWMRGIS